MNNEEWAEKMAQYFINELQEKWLENYKISDDIFSTIFLAGSPWAGKTEWIDSFLDKEKYVILDSDEYRKKFDGYIWSNAKEFQWCASRVMDKMFSFCMKNDLNVIVDGTFWNKKIIEQNIKQCIRRKRVFMVALILQHPGISYLYTKKRELEKTRNVPTDTFIKKFFTSIENTRFVVEVFPQMPVIIAQKTYSEESGIKKTEIIEVKNTEHFDKYTKKWYNKEEEIKNLISQIDFAIKIYGNKFINYVIKKLWQQKKQ